MPSPSTYTSQRIRICHTRIRHIYVYVTAYTHIPYTHTSHIRIRHSVYVYTIDVYVTYTLTSQRQEQRSGGGVPLAQPIYVYVTACTYMPYSYTSHMRIRHIYKDRNRVFSVTEIGLSNFEEKQKCHRNSEPTFVKQLRNFYLECGLRFLIVTSEGLFWRGSLGPLGFERAQHRQTFALP